MEDITINSEFDAVIKYGDFAVDDCTQQSIQLHLATSYGDWKQNPAVGVGLQTELEEYDSQDLSSEVHTQLASDGMNVKRINLSNTDGMTSVEVEASW